MPGSHRDIQGYDTPYVSADGRAYLLPGGFADVEEEVWQTPANIGMGDLILFNLKTVHRANEHSSDSFRLSIDTRVTTYIKTIKTDSTALAKTMEKLDQLGASLMSSVSPLSIGDEPRPPVSPQLRRASATPPSYMSDSDADTAFTHSTPSMGSFASDEEVFRLEGDTALVSPTSGCKRARTDNEAAQPPHDATSPTKKERYAVSHSPSAPCVD